MAARPSINLSKVSIFDWLVMGGGLLALIFSCFSYYTVNILGYSALSKSAWHGFFGWFGALLVFLAALAVAAKVFAKINQPLLPLITLALAGLGLIMVFISLFVWPTMSFTFMGDTETIGASDFGNSSGMASPGRGGGFWICFVFTIVAVAGAVMTYLNEQKKAKPQPVYGGFGAPAAQGFGQPQPGFAQPQQPQFPQQAPVVPPADQVPPVVPPVA